MSDSILKFGSLLLFFGALSKKHFELAPVWCEYYEPSELSDLDISEERMRTNFLELLNSSDERAYYSVSGIIDFTKREFLNVLCELRLDGHKLEGYLYVTQGVVNSISIFLGDDVVDLYSSDLLSEDNLETLNAVSKYLDTRVNEVCSIKYTINNIIESIDSKGAFHFPTK